VAAVFRPPSIAGAIERIQGRGAACCAPACHDASHVAASPEAPRNLPLRRRCASSRKRVTIFITLNAGRSSALPLYEYKCAKCAHQFEKIEKHNAPTTQKCPKCGGKAERMISAAGIQFKGSGWYVTDYKGKSSGASSVEGSGDGASGKSGESSSDSKSADAKSQDSKSSDAKTGESKSGGTKSGDSKSSSEKGSSKKKK
jgi:putative FmdB family regulatory protein